MRFAGLFLLLAALASAVSAQQHWVGTWAAAPAPPYDAEQMHTRKLDFNHQTLREIVRLTVGGDTVRVRLSNAFGTQLVNVGAAHIALRTSGAAIAPDTDRKLTFGGRETAQLPAGGVLLSDPVKLKVPASADLAISLYLPESGIAGGVHFSAQQTSYIAAGDATAAPTLENPTPFTSWAFLTGVDVLAPAATFTIVTFGDSITDGARSTIDANSRWPNFLATRLLSQKGAKHFAVVDMGIGGNRILNEGIASKRPDFGINALARFDSDVLAQPGVKYLIVLEGINDIGHAGSSAPASETVTAADLIAAYRQMIERAHEKGIKVIGATLTPFEGEANLKRGYYTDEKSKVRLALNEWIRTGNAFDGVIDFDKAVRDPANPNKILPAFDSGDQLHPSDAGYKAMGDAINLKLFK